MKRLTIYIMIALLLIIVACDNREGYSSISVRDTVFSDSLIVDYTIPDNNIYDVYLYSSAYYCYEEARFYGEATEHRTLRSDKSSVTLHTSSLPEGIYTLELYIRNVHPVARVHNLVKEE